MVLKYQISKYPSLTEDMIVKIWEAQSDGPGGEMYTQTIPEKNSSGVPTPGAGHQVINTITVNGLDTVVHIVRLYSAVSAALLHEYNAEPKNDIVTVFDPIQFKIGDGGTNTPAANQNTAVTPQLIGKTTSQFLINRNNYGILIPVIHFSFYPATGTWVLAGLDQFGANEEFAIILLPKAVNTVVNDSVVGKWFGGYVNVSSNTNYSSTHLRKLIRFSGTCTYTFQSTDTIPIGYGFVFQHFGTAAGSATIIFNNGTLLWAGSPKNNLILPRYCEACLVWDGLNWNVVYITESSFINGGSGAIPNTIIGTGETLIGNMAVGDHDYTITHSANVTGDYRVFLSFKGTASTAGSDNDTQASWYHHVSDKPNKFNVKLGKPVGSGTANLTLCWMLVKV
jgi:hypothetical protein